MSVILKHVCRNIRENGLRSLLIIFSLALSAAVFYVNLNIRADLYSSSQTVLDGIMSGYDLKLSGDLSLAESMLPATERTLPLSTKAAATENGEKAVIYETDLAQAVKDGTIEIVSSMEGFTPNAPHQMVMSEEKAEKYGYALGDILFAADEDENIYMLMITGLADSMGFFTQSDSTVLELVTCVGDDGPSCMLAALREDSSPSSVAAGINSTGSGLTAEVLREDNSSAGQLGSVRRLLSIILFLVIAISVYVIASTETLIIEYRFPVLGTFRSLGATAFTTDLVLLFENALYGLTALVPGLLFGELLRRLVNSIYLGGDTSSVNLIYILPVLLFILGLNLLTALFAILKNGRRSIRDLIFKKQSAAKKPSPVQGIAGLLLFCGSVGLACWNTRYIFSVLILEMLLAVAGAGLAVGPAAAFFSDLLHRPVRRLFGGPAWLGLRNLGVSRISRSTSLLVATVMAMVLMIYVVAASVTGFFESYADNYPYDVMIKFAVGAESEFAYIEQMDGVDSVVYEYWDFSSADVNGERKSICFCAADGFSNGVEAEDGLLETLQDGEAVLDRIFASVNDYSLGDVLSFTLDDGASFELTVTGFCDSGVFNSSRITVIMTRADFYRYIEVDPAIIGICTERDAHELVTELNEEIYERTGEVFDVMVKDDYLGGQVDEALNGMKSISAVPVLAIILALFGMVNNQLVAFNQNRFRYAMLYSSAMSLKQLGTAMFTELLFSFAVGVLAGTGLSLWLSRVVRDIIFVSVSYVPLVITWKQLFLSFSLLFILLCLTALFPRARLRKLNIVREIKYE